MENQRLFDTELNKLNQRVIRMCTGVHRQVSDAITAMKNINISQAKEVISRDNDIDTLDVKIDRLCQKIFALQQPVASDLRFIMSALKVNNDLERVGDHAVSIAKKVHALEDTPHMTARLGLDQVGDKLVILSGKVLELVTSRDLSFTVWIYDAAFRIEEECRTLSDRILQEMIQKSDVVVVATNILAILNHMERIAGYFTNVAESVTFVVEGVIVKHRRN
jgi:phosphate transport system protein